MNGFRLGLAFGAAAMAATAMTPAAASSGAHARAAKKPAYTTVVKTPASGTPSMLIDRKGTTLIAYLAYKGHDSYGDSYFTVKMVRKAKGSKTYKQVTLPSVFDPGTYILFQPSSGVLELLLQSGANAIFADRSTDDGVHWTAMNTTKLNDPSNRTNNLYFEVSQMAVAPHGLLEFTGQTPSGGGEVQLINPDLQSWTTVLTDQISANNPWIGRTASGTTYEISRTGQSNPVGFQAQSHTGQFNFPTCTDGTQPDLAVGHSGAVVAETGCGHVWVRYISSTGKVSPRVSLGAAPKQVSGAQNVTHLNGQAFVSLATDRAGHFTAIFVRPGGDLGVARSSNGTKWSIQNNSVPVTSVGTGLSGPSISTGSNTWLANQPLVSTSYQGVPTYGVRVIPLDDTYKPGRAPSGHGIPHAKKAHAGPLGVVAPGRVAVKHFRKTGKATVRLLSTLPESVSVGVYDYRVKGNTTYDICNTAKTVKLRPGKAKTITAVCQSGAIVIGGIAGSGVDARKGDHLLFEFVSQIGVIVIPAKVT